MCHKSFQQAWTEEEALEEYEKNFGEDAMEEKERVCTPCYDKLMVYYKAERN